MKGRRDPISVVEAAYDLNAPLSGWLQNLVDALYNVVLPEGGMTAHHIDIKPRGRSVDELADPHAPWHRADKLHELGRILDGCHADPATGDELEGARTYERLIRAALDEPADLKVYTESRPARPDWTRTVNLPVEDTFVLRNHHVDDDGVTLMVGALRKRRAVRRSERVMFQMLSAHIKTGFRLRRRLRTAPPRTDVPDGGAVLDAGGRLLHAEGDAREPDAAAGLAVLAKRIDRARSRRSGRGEDALSVWEGLVRGRWSLVESLDSDGKRYLLAHRNAEDVRDPRGLSVMESRVVGLAVRGYCDALIAYHLGIAEGTASSHLSRAIRKLGVGNRIELVRRLGAPRP
jgi:DNA-binding CsgD family transcriptional regulator